jgi:hypothetical protein
MPTFLRSEMRQKDRLIAAMESLSKMLNGYLANPLGLGSQLTQFDFSVMKAVGEGCGLTGLEQSPLRDHISFV